MTYTTTEEKELVTEASSTTPDNAVRKAYDALVEKSSTWQKRVNSTLFIQVVHAEGKLNPWRATASATYARIVEVAEADEVRSFQGETVRTEVQTS